MSATREDLDRLIAELVRDIDSLAEIEAMNARALARIDAGANDSLDWAALGYTIHSAYSCIESYCLRVAKAFENNIDMAMWHKDLLSMITIEIPNVRPALLERDAFRLLDELRAFRYIFRTIYADRLDPERMALAARRFAPALAAFRAAHRSFRIKMEAIRDAMDRF